MANEVKLNCYTLQIRERHSRNQKSDFETLKDVFYNDGTSVKAIDFSDFFRNFITSFDGQFKGIVGNSTAVYLPPNEISFASEKRMIHGFMKAGRTGTGRTILEMSKPDEEVFRVLPEHVDSTDYFFLVWFPSDSNTGLVIVQGLSTESASEIFRRLMNKFFSDKVDSHVVEISRYVPKETIEKMKEDGEIDKITLSKHRLDPDRANHILGTTFIHSDISIEIKIKGLKGYSQQIKDFIEGDPRFFSTQVLEEVGMDGTHDIAVEYEFNGKKATAKQSKGFQLSPYYYVDEESIQRDPTTNLPTKQSLRIYCLDFFEMIVREMNPNHNW